MNVLDLFSGIGGFSLGLERAGMRTVAFCEIEPYCRAVLAKRWPGIPIHGDVRELRLPRGFAQVVCGGFPCQDISVAGDGAGLAGFRSGLWSEYRRLIEEVQPEWVAIENVSALRSRGLDQVLRQLSAIGYDAEWYCIPASAVGAPHRRDRVWIIAYPQRQLVWQQSGGRERQDGTYQVVAAVNGTPCIVADADGPRLERWLRAELQEECAAQWAARTGSPSIPDPDSVTPRRPSESRGECDFWRVEPDVGRVANGIPSRMDRLRSLGNAVVPQIPEIIGRAIMKATQDTSSERQP